MTDLERLQACIKHLAMEISPDYPDIETCDVYEHLWIIHTALKGIQKANADWQAFGENVRVRYKLDTAALQSLFPEHLK